jgi:hypothetical protein
MSNFTDFFPAAVGVDLQSSVKTANFTAVANEGYLVNTTSSAITVTLPSSPSLGDEVLIIDYAGTFGTNNVTLTSSDNILGFSDDYAIPSNDVSVILIYTDATKGWKVKTGANEGTSALTAPPVTADFLVVAGGGAGANDVGGGGGAGGLRTSYGSTSGGGASAESSLNLLPGTNYTVTVGAGGTYAYSASSAQDSGNNSVFYNITSTGGGGGAFANVNGVNGGSGGGGGRRTGAGGLGTANQGYDGGAGTYYTSDGSGGGGGGAAGAGASNASGGSNGGTALSINITGAAVEYAGGGGGGSGQGGTGGTGGGGGAGNGGGSAGSSGTAASANKGSGGGGGGNSGGPGANGGSGVVILRYPNTHTITAGAGLTSSTTTDGSDKVTTFTAGTDTISFS